MKYASLLFYIGIDIACQHVHISVLRDLVYFFKCDEINLLFDFDSFRFFLDLIQYALLNLANN